MSNYSGGYNTGGYAYNPATDSPSFSSFSTPPSNWDPSVFVQAKGQDQATQMNARALEESMNQAKDVVTSAAKSLWSGVKSVGKTVVVEYAKDFASMLLSPVTAVIDSFLPGRPSDDVVRSVAGEAAGKLVEIPLGRENYMMFGITSPIPYFAQPVTAKGILDPLAIPGAYKSSVDAYVSGTPSNPIVQGGSQTRTIDSHGRKGRSTNYYGSRASQPPTQGVIYK
jgi:hypothetical protein